MSRKVQVVAYPSDGGRVRVCTSIEEANKAVTHKLERLNINFSLWDVRDVDDTIEMLKRMRNFLPFPKEKQVYCPLTQGEAMRLLLELTYRSVVGKDDIPEAYRKDIDLWAQSMPNGLGVTLPLSAFSSGMYNLWYIKLLRDGTYYDIMHKLYGEEEGK